MGPAQGGAQVIVANEKPLEEILRMVQGYRRILVLGCNTCTAVCLSGGEREARQLASQIRAKAMIDGEGPQVEASGVERQCEPEFLTEYLDDWRERFDLVVSLACGAGVQTLAELLEDRPVVPALNTAFIGSYQGDGTWVEMCKACGDCVLERTGGICPVTRCAKGLLNGPCGGSQGGSCEVDPEKPCAWHLIYERLKRLGQLERLREFVPPKRWALDRKDGGPRKRVRRDVTLPAFRKGVL